MAKVKPKSKSNFVCQACGFINSKWMGKCPECGAWDSLVEERMEEDKRGTLKEAGFGGEKPRKLHEITLNEEERMLTGIGELDLVLGGGLVKGSLVLVGGEPGIGKSTLLLQAADQVARDKRKVLYVSGEESLRQTKLRAARLGIAGEELYLISENELELIFSAVSDLKPDLVIIDSIQTVFQADISSAPGSVSQVREATGQLMRLAKGMGITVLIVGHVTKSGAIAGPKVLEHMVDTVLYFEGEKHNLFRVLRAVKNRFGSTNEVGIFEMTGGGLMEVSNPSQLFLLHRPSQAAGSVVMSSVEGSRPILVEIQALAAPAPFGTPRRMAVGVDYNRSAMLIAVLEKRLGMRFQDHDAYINVVGGMELGEPAADLAVMAALASSLRNDPLEADMVVFGEVGLTGEVRAVSGAEKRVVEAQKLGFRKVVMPMANMAECKDIKGITMLGALTLEDAFKHLFGR